MPDEPLIFVEVALLPEMAGAIAPLIDKRSAPLPAEQFKVAVFYSISNCQPGLRGVSLGNFLIKRVAEHLKRELPQLKTFCTLSPIPGFAGLAAARRRRALLGASAARRPLRASCARPAAASSATLATAARLAALGGHGHHALWRLAAHYLVHVSPQSEGDPVARFHLDNGARLERLNAQANLSAKGLKQSAGLMVNYLYDLGKIELHHDRFAHGKVVAQPRRVSVAVKPASPTTQETLACRYPLRRRVLAACRGRAAAPRRWRRRRPGQPSR